MTIPPCPKCKSRLVTRERTCYESGVAKFFYWLCQACGETWSDE